MKHLTHSQLALLERSLESQERQLRADIRCTLLQSDHPAQRLLAYPVSTRCVACAQKHERTHAPGF